MAIQHGTQKGQSRQISQNLLGSGFGQPGPSMRNLTSFMREYVDNGGLELRKWPMT